MLGTIVASRANYRKRAIQLAKITSRTNLACVIAALILISTRRTYNREIRARWTVAPGETKEAVVVCRNRDPTWTKIARRTW